MAELFQFGWFAGHAGFQLPWKMDCDAWTDERMWPKVNPAIFW